MTTKRFRATTSHKILILSSAAYAVLFTIVAFLLRQSENMPAYVGVTSIIILLLLVGRYVAAIRFPAIEVRENQLIIFGWLGGKGRFDLSAPIEMASTGDGIVLKQGKSGAGIGRYVIGKEQYEEVVQILYESQVNIGR